MRNAYPMTVILVVSSIVLSLAKPEWAIADAREIAHLELWRLITGPMVHSDLGQAGRDISMLALVGLVWEPLFSRRYLLLAILCMIVPTAIAIALHFELGAYFGMSGAVNGLFTAALISDYRRSKSRLIAVLLAVHAAKLCYEMLFGMLLPLELASGVTPLPEAHLAGALTGLCFSWAESLRRTDTRLSLPAR